MGESFTADFLIDSGACANAISPKTWSRFRDDKKAVIIGFQWGDCKPLKAVNNSEVTVLGRFITRLEVVEATRPSDWEDVLIVKDAIDNIICNKTAVKMDILRVGITAGIALMSLKEEPEFPKIPNLQYRLSINRDVPPVRNTSYFLPLAYEEETEKEICEWERQKIVEKAPVDSVWCHRMDSVKKAGGRRTIVDMRSANKALYRDLYQMPHPETIFPKLAGARHFTKLDLKNAFFHVELHPDSREITTFMTKRGMMRFRRLPFGMNVAPEVFQRIMQEVLDGCEGCTHYIDDILVFAKSAEELEERTKRVERALRRNNLTLNKGKCEYNKAQVTFLGNVITAEGARPTCEKLACIKKFRAPKNATELRSFIGTANFMNESTKGFSALTEPLRQLLKSNQKWKWEEEEQRAFSEMKRIITNESVTRAFFDQTAKTLLYTDASPWALGAMLAQEVDTDFEGKKIVTIACASKSLTPTERRYYQTHREMLAVVWAVEHFSYYLLGRFFTLYTDHDPLQHTLEKSKATNKRAMTRTECWAMRMAAYTYECKRVGSKDNVADALSRLYEGDDDEFNVDEENTALCAITENETRDSGNCRRIKYDQVAEESKSCPLVRAIIDALRGEADWKPELEKYREKENEIFIENDCIIRSDGAGQNEKFIPPESLRKKIIEIGHDTHMSVSSMKRLVRDRFWWPGMDGDITRKVESCEECQQLAKAPRMLPLSSTKQPERPWEFIGIDHFSALFDKVNLIVIQDYFSRFLIVRMVESVDTRRSIAILEEVFNTYGIPEKLRTDEGTSWKSGEFVRFCKDAGIRNETSAPYAQWQNGLAERAMQTVKRAATIAVMRTNRATAQGAPASEISVKAEIRKRVKTAIYWYNRTPHSTTLKAPIEILFGRKTSDLFPLTREQKNNDSDENEWAEFRERDAEARKRTIDRANERNKPTGLTLKIGDEVIIKNHAKGKLIPSFGNKKYRVDGINGVNVSLVDDKGTRISRYAQHVRKYKRPAESSPAPASKT